ncbi:MULTISPECIES: PTS sugar transporter subunit IIB [Niallia]|jgi:cellobiose PTS system EIIB component|uniref:PTS sugar transporter subunit IIB n=1 Tax=Niallia circulans TaxID=1397 RepID=A0A268FFT1_NIACI|nr:PTS sugar transporter subunit IIB [Niallia circulans]AYV68609.1 PTS sugar transporter subunit IIB [Niallia circulans]AYV72997.1 PTS sugar transporter subunit IIB [Niallia circulans]PAD84224.1 PTS sugar transporter subunit IIB [Niallia circulans]QJX64517.1 PTS sugar transporter subunit IIB [Niallia circulans]UQZ75330.1 PTS sugar transporter subunit IIB [Niallia circulans]
MKRILLACSSGMSTSLLVSKMKDAAKEKGIEAEIWAVAQDKAQTDMERADVLLIGPQMRFLKKKLATQAEAVGIPLDVIDPVAYGRIDGLAVLNKALELIENNK